MRSLFIEISVLTVTRRKSNWCENNKNSREGEREIETFEGPLQKIRALKLIESIQDVLSTPESNHFDNSFHFVRFHFLVECRHRLSNRAVKMAISIAPSIMSVRALFSISFHKSIRICLPYNFSLVRSFPDNLSVCACRAWCESRTYCHRRCCSGSGNMVYANGWVIFFRAFLPQFIYFSFRAVWRCSWLLVPIYTYVWYIYYLFKYYVSSLLAAHTRTSTSDTRECYTFNL